MAINISSTERQRCNRFDVYKEVNDWVSWYKSIRLKIELEVINNIYIWLVTSKDEGYSLIYKSVV